MLYKGSAIVIGDYAAASAALKHFDRVTLIDDIGASKPLPQEPKISQTKKRRSGAPQYTEPHLSVSGAQSLEALFPGFTKVISKKSRTYDAAQGLYVYDFGGSVVSKAYSGVEVICSSRRLVNETLRDLLAQQCGPDHLTVRDNAKVVGLLWERPHAEPSSYNVMNRVRGCTGVVLASGEEIKADLVIVCNGYRSQLPAWLEKEGLQLPPQLTVDCKMNFATRWMRLPADFNPENEFFSAVVNGRPALARGATAFVLEDNRIQISMTGYGKEAAPLDHEGWMDYAASLPDQSIYNLAKRCTPLSTISRYASTPNTSYQYHKMTLPEGLIIMGDTFTSLNPAASLLPGQGMGLAAQQALLFEQALVKILKGKVGETRRVYAVRAMGPKFHKLLEKKISTAWNLSTTEDMRWPGAHIEGVVKPSAFSYNYLDAIVVAAQQNKQVWKQLVRASQFVAPPAGMFTPRMVACATKNIIFSSTKKVKKASKNNQTVVPLAVVATRSQSLTSSVESSLTRAGTEGGYSDGGKDVDLGSAEKPEVKGAVAA